MKSIHQLVAEFLDAKKAGHVLHIAIDEQHSEHNPYLTIIFRHGVLNDVVRERIFQHIENSYDGVYAEAAPHAPSMIFIYFVPTTIKVAA